MYQSPYFNYYIPDLEKYWCRECGKYFILSSGYDNSNVICPYCKDNSAQSEVTLEDPDLLSELGCLAIGFNK